MYRPSQTTHLNLSSERIAPLQGGSALGARSVILTGRFPLNRNRTAFDSSQSAQSRYGSRELQDLNPTSPALTAILIPKLRIELADPSLTYIVLVTRGVHLGDLLRIWYGPAHEINYLPRIFKANKGAPDTARDAVLLQNSVPYTPDTDSRDTNLTKKNNSSPGPPSTSPSSVALPQLGPEGPISVSGLGNINPFPFGRQRTNTSMCLRFGERPPLRNGFLRSLRTRLTHVQLLFTWNPISSFSPQGLT
ncbi:hypothetical protein JTE90_012997 [Oedothorax gibbosus]|uniref:Uncharacterized protein n=1 Tax=Oedothorax gibbosus TaxID=931172 RepID=A0AAV6TI18_9ARAC|nr:hypothetical protein JTE90_012997 [Oedothorax gibbosus]